MLRMHVLGRTAVKPSTQSMGPVPTPVAALLTWSCAERRQAGLGYLVQIAHKVRFYFHIEVRERVLLIGRVFRRIPTRKDAAAAICTLMLFQVLLHLDRERSAPA